MPKRVVISLKLTQVEANILLTLIIHGLCDLNNEVRGDDQTEYDEADVAEGAGIMSKLNRLMGEKWPEGQAEEVK